MLIHSTKFPRVLLQLQSSTFCSFSLSRSGRSGRSTAEDHLQGPHQSEVALVCEWGDDQTKRVPEILITVRTTCCNLMKSRRLQFTIKKRLKKEILSHHLAVKLSVPIVSQLRGPTEVILRIHLVLLRLRTMLRKDKLRIMLHLIIHQLFDHVSRMHVNHR